MSRAVRGVLIAALLMSLGAFAPAGWFWIATVPLAEYRESSPFGGTYTLGPNLPYGIWFADPIEQVRVCRWGEHRGERHGRSRCFDAEGRLRAEGQFDHDTRVGLWTVWSASGSIQIQGEHDRDGDRTGIWLDSIEGNPVEIDFRRDRMTRWRFGRGVGATRWLPVPQRDGVGFGEGNYRFRESPRERDEVGLGEWRPIRGLNAIHWVPIGTWFRVRAGVGIESFGPMDGTQHGLWTTLGESGEIVRQELYERGWPRPDFARTAPPWYDLAPCYDPSVPLSLEQSPDDSDVVTSAAEDPGAPDPDEE